MTPTGTRLAYAVMTEVGIVSQLATKELSRVLGTELNPSAFGVVNHLIARPEPASPTHLAAAFQMTKPSMTAILAELERSGLVVITPSKQDRRKKHVSLSEAGRSAHAAALERLEPALQSLLDAIGEDRLRAAYPMLVEIRTILDEGRNRRDFGTPDPKPGDP
ncbi:MAG: MarR family transcriptional regulator [Pseudomonadota bacterium]